MKSTIKTKIEVNIRYLKVDAKVRYWEDSDVDGTEDVNLYQCQGQGTPRMPFAVKVKDYPTSNIYSDHWRWQPTIDVEKGCIVNWPIGTTARIHYKVCDEGHYQLLDAEGKCVVDVNSYVPTCIGEWGDYIVMNIDENGQIDGFHFSQDDVNEIIKNDFGYKED